MKIKISSIDIKSLYRFGSTNRIPSVNYYPYQYPLVSGYGFWFNNNNAIVKYKNSKDDEYVSITNNFILFQIR